MLLMQLLQSNTFLGKNLSIEDASSHHCMKLLLKNIHFTNSYVAAKHSFQLYFTVLPQRRGKTTVNFLAKTSKHKSCGGAKCH